LKRSRNPPETTFDLQNISCICNITVHQDVITARRCHRDRHSLENARHEQFFAFEEAMNTTQSIRSRRRADSRAGSDRAVARRGAARRNAAALRAAGAGVVAIVGLLAAAFIVPAAATYAPGDAAQLEAPPVR
jgi:hypothetical protein